MTGSAVGGFIAGIAVGVAMLWVWVILLRNE